MASKPGDDPTMLGMAQAAMVALTVELVPRVAPGFVESQQLFAAFATGVEHALAQGTDERLTSVSNKAEAVFQDMDTKTKVTDTTHNTFRRLEAGGSDLVGQTKLLQAALGEVSNKVEETRREVNNDGSTTKQDLSNCVSRYNKRRRKTNSISIIPPKTFRRQSSAARTTRGKYQPTRTGRSLSR